MWEDDVKIDLKGMERYDWDWIHCSQDRKQRQISIEDECLE
jgi:hypothetical protein